MSKILDCPHRVSLSSITFYCLKGRFPIDCENCDCKDKRYYEVYTSTNITTIETMMWRGEINEDLEEEIARYIYDVGLPNEEELVDYLREIARHFSNWQKEQDKNSSSSVDLESKDVSDLIDKLSKRYPEVSFAKLARIVVAATKWQKSQDQQTIELAEEHAMLAGMIQERERMMKDAVDGWVARDKDGDIAIFREVPTKDAEIGMWKPCKSAYIFPNKDEYPDVTWDSEPQKVKVIIIKE